MKNLSKMNFFLSLMFIIKLQLIIYDSLIMKPANTGHKNTDVGTVSYQVISRQG